MIDPTPCDCEQCTELRLSTDQETVEFMRIMDAGWERATDEERKQIEDSKQSGEVIRD